MKTPLIGICRHRLTTDGTGVTTLVAFHGCPLSCRYCLNSQCLRPDGVWQRLTAEEILQQTVVDDLYFQATGGGIERDDGVGARLELIGVARAVVAVGIVVLGAEVNG